MSCIEHKINQHLENARILRERAEQKTGEERLACIAAADWNQQTAEELQNEQKS